MSDDPQLEHCNARIGTVLRGKWRIDSLIGVGGMAAVYGATHKIGRRAAIKILHPEIAVSEEFRARFEQEALAVNQIGHPAAVNVLDIDTTEDGTPFLVMELLDGESLGRRAKRSGGIEERELLRIASAVLEVLEVAHRLGIVHRDIKPDNLFLTSSGGVKVLDFGIARMTQGGANVRTRTGATLGTTAYMPPEQIAGGQIDGRADIFAVGATMLAPAPAAPAVRSAPRAPPAPQEQLQRRHGERPACAGRTRRLHVAKVSRSKALTCCDVRVDFPKSGCSFPSSLRLPFDIQVPWRHKEERCHDAVPSSRMRGALVCGFGSCRCIACGMRRSCDELLSRDSGRLRPPPPGPDNVERIRFFPSRWSRRSRRNESPQGCDPTVSVSSDGPALIVRDPLVLERFSLERVLGQIVDQSAQSAVTPEELLQQLFDTQNTAASAVFPNHIHCDGGGNQAFKNGSPADCPRAEGMLASSPGLFTLGDPDYFAPVALVNRFDLMTRSSATCGEYRIVYAKWSGRTDPNNRLFVVFEGALPNPLPGQAMGCWPVAALWAGLEKEQDPAVIASRLETFYFDGLPGSSGVEPGFMPLVHPAHFGFGSFDNDFYGRSNGQVRVSQHMQDPWELREFRLAGPGGDMSLPPIFFAPVTVKNNPLPNLFDPANADWPIVGSLQGLLVDGELERLSADGVTKIRLQLPNIFNAGESALSGAAHVDYSAVALGGASAPLADAITARLSETLLGEACPPDDPLTAQSILRRITTQSCAGCHAPEHFFGPDRKIGCGLAWPGTLGQVHIDEHGALSPALIDVFLPRRASVMTTFVQGCDKEAILANLEADPEIPLK